MNDAQSTNDKEKPGEWELLKASFYKTVEGATLFVLCLPKLGYFAARVEHRGGAYKAHPVEFALGCKEAMETADRLRAVPALADAWDEAIRIADSVRSESFQVAKSSANLAHSAQHTGAWKVVKALESARDAALAPDRANPLAERVAELIASLTDEQRVELFNRYCKACGAANDPRCQCWNDE